MKWYWRELVQPHRQAVGHSMAQLPEGQRLLAKRVQVLCCHTAPKPFILRKLIYKLRRHRLQQRITSVRL